MRETDYGKYKKIEEDIYDKEQEIEKIRDKITVRHRTEPQVVFELNSPLKYDLYLPISFGVIDKKRLLNKFKSFTVTGLLLYIDIATAISSFETGFRNYNLFVHVIMLLLLMFAHLIVLTWMVKVRKNKARAKQGVNLSEVEYNK